MPPKSEVEEALAEIKSGLRRPCYLLYGKEEFLLEDALKRLVSALLPPQLRDFNLLTLEGDSITLKGLTEALLTFPLLAGPKVVVVREARFLQPARASAEHLERIRELAKSDLAQAAREFARFLARQGLKVSDLVEVADERWHFLGEDRAWAEPVIKACLWQGIEEWGGEGMGEAVSNLLTSGLPEGHTLIVTASNVDERLKLFRVMASCGRVIHFAAPKGEKEGRERLIACAEELLSSVGKRLSAGAWDLLGAKTGYDLREAMGELEKLVVLTGERKVITEADVASTVEKTKVESVFRLTSALARKEERETLKVLNELLDQEVAPPALVSLLARELGLLLRARLLLEVTRGQVESMEPREFERNFLPTLKELSPEISALHPYVAYHLLKNAALFEQKELAEAINRLAEVDRLMKTTACDPRLLLERFVLSF
ncbi:MAG TPA: DNA polymerase III subunit delta [Syntrophales bacterium]|nr:DNA polymerase III subunit delta [Syntrophales bacterium]HOL59846.1 DNA polymerase III subunit delta [Syntrophales bacterium]HPO35993.1 DNA polymerase III subunit delta [Syntrophales bacterium]